MQEELVRSTTFRYITDVITPEEDLKMLKAIESGKKEREQKVREIGYPAYVTSAGWLGMIQLLFSDFPNRFMGLSFAGQNSQHTQTIKSPASPRKPSHTGSTTSKLKLAPTKRTIYAAGSLSDHSLMTLRCYLLGRPEGM